MSDKQHASVFSRLAADIDTVRASWHAGATAEQRDLARATLHQIRANRTDVVGYTCPLLHRELSPRAPAFIAARLLAHAAARDAASFAFTLDSPDATQHVLDAVRVLSPKHLPTAAAILVRAVADAGRVVVGLTDAQKQHHEAWVKNISTFTEARAAPAGIVVAREIVDILAPLYACDALAAAGAPEMYHTDATLRIVRAAAAADGCTSALFAIIETVVGRFSSILPIPPHLVAWLDHVVAAAVHHGADPDQLAAFIVDLDLVTPLPAGHSAYQICDASTRQLDTGPVSKKPKRKQLTSSRGDGDRVLPPGDRVRLGHRHAPG